MRGDIYCMSWDSRCDATVSCGHIITLTYTCEHTVLHKFILNCKIILNHQMNIEKMERVLTYSILYVSVDGICKTKFMYQEFMGYNAN